MKHHRIIHHYRLVLALLVVLLLAGCTSQGTEPDFTFVFMTDIHVQPERQAAQGYSQAIARVNALQPDFIITGGDLIMDALGQGYGRADSLYSLYNALTQEAEAPIYHTIGNHEVFGLYEGSGIDPSHPEYGKQMYLDRMGLDRTYYSFDRNGWHFIMLDGIGFTPERRYYGYVDSVQLDWLAMDLETVGKETPIIVSTHIPFVSVVPQLTQGGQASASPGYLITNVHEVMAVLKDYNLKLVLQGHLHHVEDVYYDGIHFLTGGAVCARWWRGPNNGMPEGFMVLKVRGETIDWEYVSYDWVVPQEDQ